MAEQKIPALIASGGTVVTGVSTYNSWLPMAVGCFASLVGAGVSCFLGYLAWKKNNEELRQARLVTSIIARKENERLARKEQGIEDRRAEG